MKKAVSKKPNKKTGGNPEDLFLKNPSNRMEVLLGDLKDRIQLVAEGVTMSNEKIDRLKADVEVLQTDMNEVKGRLALVENDVSEIKQNFATKSQVSSGLLGMEKRLGTKIEKLNQVVFS